MFHLQSIDDDRTRKDRRFNVVRSWDIWERISELEVRNGAARAIYITSMKRAPAMRSAENVIAC